MTVYILFLRPLRQAAAEEEALLGGGLTRNLICFLMKMILTSINPKPEAVHKADVGFAHCSSYQYLVNLVGTIEPWEHHLFYCVLIFTVNTTIFQSYIFSMNVFSCGKDQIHICIFIFAFLLHRFYYLVPAATLEGTKVVTVLKFCIKVKTDSPETHVFM